MLFILVDAFEFLHLVYFFSYLCFSMFYLTHACILDMDECLHASLVYL
jgi:hypothetical protein